MQYLKPFALTIDQGNPSMRGLKEGVARGFEAA